MQNLTPTRIEFKRALTQREQLRLEEVRVSEAVHGVTTVTVNCSLKGFPSLLAVMQHDASGLTVRWGKSSYFDLKPHELEQVKAELTARAEPAIAAGPGRYSYEAQR